MRYPCAMRATWLVALLLAGSAGCRERDPEASQPPASARPPAAAESAESAGAAAAAETPAHRSWPSLRSAFEATWEHSQRAGATIRVIGFGEYHQTADTAELRSALSRFTDEIVPALRGRVSDLVIETWPEPSACDAPAQRASAEIDTAIERPAQTQSELGRLLEQARASDIRPHILPFDCDTYRALLGADGAVDFEALLLAITERLRAEVLAGLEHEDAVIAVYGGALHNDLYPAAGVSDFSYAAAVDKAAGGGYLEIDLIVPEFAAGVGSVARAAWAPLLEQTAPERVLALEARPRAHVFLLERSAP
ncbi:hypothetical protein Hoch_4123 [Haliangium ochraceum DSM 14365]|uniref:Haem-binding uptake Tiki superfamily ChaN domain-containing protein n=2 Tax=Haliangium ochraceum TaxID=80816 RepID=D0LJP7_HALO1|nr:hypothetical protein Hoch_4123 [Haliangium ochraceum DSM 14365]